MIIHIAEKNYVHISQFWITFPLKVKSVVNAILKNKIKEFVIAHLRIGACKWLSCRSSVKLKDSRGLEKCLLVLILLVSPFSFLLKTQ